MIKFIALSGFLGAGKTTTLVSAARLLESQGHRVAVVTNDQGTELVDTKLARSSLDKVAEVTGGCFCCRFDDLMSVVDRLIGGGTVDTVIAEAVGSCTDLQATVVRPLRKYHGDQFSVAPLTTIVDPHRQRGFARAAERGEPESDLSYLFGKQLAEADIIAVNKADLISAEEREAVTDTLRRQYPAATILPYSARTGEGLASLIDAWSAEASWAGDLTIDYDRYASAEAQLAWLNQQFTVEAVDSPGFPPLDWAKAALCRLAEAAGSDPGAVGHAKLTIDTDSGMTKLSLTGTTAEPFVDQAEQGPARSGRVNFNARIACEPAAMDQAVLDAVAYADALYGTRSASAETGPVSFKPGYPTPVHRLTAAQM